MKFILRLFNSSILKNSWLFLLLIPMIAVSQTKIIKDSIVKIPKALVLSEIPNFDLKTIRLLENINELIKNNSELIEFRKKNILYDSLINNKLLVLRVPYQ